MKDEWANLDNSAIKDFYTAFPRGQPEKKSLKACGTVKYGMYEARYCQEKLNYVCKIFKTGQCLSSLAIVSQAKTSFVQSVRSSYNARRMPCSTRTTVT